MCVCVRLHSSAAARRFYNSTVNDNGMTLPPQRGGPVLAVGGHHSAQLVAGQRRSGGARPLPGRQQGGRAAEEADRESHVSFHNGGATRVEQSQNERSSHLTTLWLIFKSFFSTNSLNIVYI